MLLKGGGLPTGIGSPLIDPAAVRVTRGNAFLVVSCGQPTDLPGSTMPPKVVCFVGKKYRENFSLLYVSSRSLSPAELCDHTRSPNFSLDQELRGGGVAAVYLLEI